jgi:hypothetical protein
MVSAPLQEENLRKTAEKGRIHKENIKKAGAYAPA